MHGANGWLPNSSQLFKVRAAGVKRLPHVRYVAPLKESSALTYFSLSVPSFLTVRGYVIDVTTQDQIRVGNSLLSQSHLSNHTDGVLQPLTSDPFAAYTLTANGGCAGHRETDYIFMVLWRRSSFVFPVNGIGRRFQGRNLQVLKSPVFRAPTEELCLASRINNSARALSASHRNRIRRQS